MLYNWKINTRICEEFTLNWSAFVENKDFPWGIRKENIQITGEIFYEKIELVSLYIKNNNLYLKIIDKHLYECLITSQSEKNHIWNWTRLLEFLIFFTFMKQVYVNRARYFLACWIICLGKRTSEIGLEFLGFFTFINFLSKSQRTERWKTECKHVLYFW